MMDNLLNLSIPLIIIFGIYYTITKVTESSEWEDCVGSGSSIEDTPMEMKLALIDKCSFILY